MPITYKPVEKRHDNAIAEPTDLIDQGDHPAGDVGGHIAPPAPGASVDEMRAALTALVHGAVEDYLASDAHHVHQAQAQHAGPQKNDLADGFSNLNKAASAVDKESTRQNNANDNKAYAPHKSHQDITANSITPKTAAHIDAFAAALGHSRGGEGNK